MLGAILRINLLQNFNQPICLPEEARKRSQGILPSIEKVPIQPSQAMNRYVQETLFKIEDDTVRVPVVAQW